LGFVGLSKNRRSRPIKKTERLEITRIRGGWRGVFRTLAGESYRYRFGDIARMTLPQILHALDQSASSIPTEQLAAERRHEIFSELLVENGWLPSRLLDLPIGEVAKYLSIKTEQIDLANLPVFIEQFIRQFEQELS
jgi:hypothetical protein